MTILYHDTETFSEIAISNGVHAYCEGNVEVMIDAWAIDGRPISVFDATDGDPLPTELFDALMDPTVEIVGHNYGMFDRTVQRHARGLIIDPARIIDTQVQARSHGLPGGLDKLCSIFKVPADLTKDKRGKQLIQLFCKPRPKTSKLRRATKYTHPVEWQQFLDYAGNDISSMRWLRREMPNWNYPANPHERALWVLDQKINDRGFRVDLDLARGAIATVAQVKEEKDAETQELTEDRLRSTHQRDQLLKELLFEYGVFLPDMQAYTIEKRLEDPDLPPEVKELLATRLMVSTTSTSKYNKLLTATSSDCRLRGSLVFSGAARTKRKSGAIFQPQNLPRPDMKQPEIEAGIEMMKEGIAHLMHDEPNRLAWNALRGSIIAEEGKKLVQADLSGIEARVLPWLAREQWKLDAFRAHDAGTGPDLYRVGAARILRVEIDEITGEQRQSHGKVPELACGYGGSIGAFKSMSKIYNIDLPDWEIMEIVREWRAANFEIADWDVGFWSQLDHAARMAIGSPGTTFEAGPYIRFERWRNWLRMELPSGGFLSYAAPLICADPRRPGKDAISFMGINNYTKRWKRLYTYGGKLSADATQATARDIIYHNAPWVEANSYPIVLEVHDELLCETLDNLNYSVEELISLLLRRPPWIDDNLPLAAGGFEGPRYKKEG